MILSKKYKVLLTVFSFVFLIFAGLFLCFGLSAENAAFAAKGVLAADRADGEKTLIELFVFAPCESCNEEEEFSEEVRTRLTDAGINCFACEVYNVYKESGASRFEEIADEYGISFDINDLPAAIVQGKVFFGTYKQIGEALAGYLQAAITDGTKPAPETENANDTQEGRRAGTDSTVYRDILEIGKDDTAMLLFVTGSCDSCERAEEYLRSNYTDGRYKLIIYNIMKDDNAAVLRKLMKIYEVPESLQQVPLLLLKNTYLSGADSIRKNVAEYIESADAEGPWDETAIALSEGKDDIGISKLRLAATGFANGLNPCGISMLLMVLSVILMSGKSFYKGSIVYLLGRFLTYLLLGFTFGSLFGIIESNAFRAVHGTLNIIFAVLALGFGSFYLLDFIHVLRKDYGKERLRLPERFRKWNHDKIKRLADVQGGLWYPMLFLLGIAISAGEFLCTGQVYLATLLYMAEQTGAFNGEIVGSLLIYLIAMCVPMVILVVLVSKGRSVMAASHLSLKLLPFVKLAYSIFFFVLFFSLLL